MSPRPAADSAARRDQVIRDARDIAEKEGWPAVTVRRLAAGLGLSQPMLYALFAGRQDVVDAVALAGFGELVGLLDEASHKDPRAVATAYLDFAEQHPATYEAMFVLPSGLRFATARTPAPMRAAFDSLREAVGAGDGIRTELAWSALHGLVTLSRTRRLPARAKAERLEEFLKVFGNGRPAGRTR